MAAWRRMSVADAPALQRIADEIHTDLPEGEHVFAERVRLFPEGCLVLADGAGVCGYAISHPIRRHHPPTLDSLLGEIPPDADHYYIHDIAVLPRVRGQGLAGDCVKRLLEVAKRYLTTSLISVYGTVPFWSRFGFGPEPIDEGLREKLSGYGEGAVYLSRDNGVDRGSSI